MATTDVVSAFRRTSDGDIHLAAFLLDRNGLQPYRFFRRMRSGFDLELVAMPWTDDAHFGFVEGVARRYLLVVDQLADGGNDQPLADRAAHMRARVLVGEEPAVDAKYADGLLADVDDETPFFGDVLAAAGAETDWGGCVRGHLSLIIPSLQTHNRLVGNGTDSTSFADCRRVPACFGNRGRR